jgi:RNA polymerase sigma-70 factor (ECF subfamily)
MESEPSAWEIEQERVKEMIDYAEKNLSKPAWRVFQLRFDEGLLYREIAERLGVSEVTVYKHLVEALKKLKEKFNPTRR